MVVTIGNKLLLTIHGLKETFIDDITITLLNNECGKKLVVIKEIMLACSHKCTSKHLDVLSHNSGVLSQQIETIVNTETKDSTVEFLCGGNIQRMTPEECQKFQRKYVRLYYSSDEENIDDNCLEEPIQFPQRMLNQPISVFAQRLKNIISKSKHRLFTIFTHYNTKQHINFLKLNEEFAVTSENDFVTDNRMLLLFPNTIMNLRYTDATDPFDLQDEFNAGEQDLRELSILNKKFIKSEKMKLVNVVAAPNFEKNHNTGICFDCCLLSKEISSVDGDISRFFLDILQEFQVDHSSKEQYVAIVGQIMCFMATRTALYSVPSLSDNVHEQISSLILTTQQLRILYNSFKKKIVTGSLGSGKTVLALSHLELAYHISESNSVIYYIIWDDKSLLKRDVIRHADRFNYRSDVAVKIKDIVELAKDLRMKKVPSPSQLMSSLVEKHASEMFHLIIDEFNGEILNEEEASTLKRYLEEEARVKDSLIVIFPQSIEKHRTYFSYGSFNIHDTYKYNLTGMKVFHLNKGMRTSKEIFKFLKAFEKELMKVKTTVKFPVQKQEQHSYYKHRQQQQNSYHTHQQQQQKQQQQQGQGQQQSHQQRQLYWQQQLYQQQQQEEQTLQLQDKLQEPQRQNKQQEPQQQEKRQGQQQSHQQQQLQEKQQLQLKHTQQEQQEKEQQGKPFESPIDIDVVAASINEQGLSGDVRIDTELECNSADMIGHGIKGTKSILIHPVTDPNTDGEFIVMLALLPEDLTCNSKRLFIYNTVSQANVLYTLLKLLKLEFYHYNESSNWKLVRDSDKTTVVNVLKHKSYNILTTHEGSRGVEAAECVCIINKDDCKLKHLTLEGMSRATKKLMLVSKSNISASNVVKGTTGHIVNELMSEYLFEHCVTLSAHQ